jgi:hypothetical protein
MQIVADKCRVIGTRIHPGSDLLLEIQKIAKDNNITCGVILSLVGSLKQGRIRLVFDPRKQHVIYNEGTGQRLQSCRAYDVLQIAGPLEIVCAGGTISENAETHIHVVLSDGENVYGGHLIEGNTIYTTAEVFLLSLPNVISTRIFDHETRHRELAFKSKNESGCNE